MQHGSHLHTVYTDFLQFQAEDPQTQPGILSFYGEEDNPELVSEHESLDDIPSAIGSLVASEENALLHGGMAPMIGEPMEGDNSTTSELVCSYSCISWSSFQLFANAAPL